MTEWKKLTVQETFVLILQIKLVSLLVSPPKKGGKFLVDLFEKIFLKQVSIDFDLVVCEIFLLVRYVLIYLFVLFFFLLQL